MTEYALRRKYVAICESYLGATKGSARHKEILNVYNSQKPLPRGYKMTVNDPWCATFVTAMSILAEIQSIVPGECSCTRQVSAWKKLGCWIENDAYTPTTGDIIYYNWSAKSSGDTTEDPDHVGVVVSVTSKTIKVIEGNKGNAVAYRYIPVDYRYTRGFAVPKYSKLADTKLLSVTEIAKEVVAGKWGTGADRKARLTKAGYDYDKVQAKVNDMLSTKKSVDAVAKEVIAGKWGSGAVRKSKLKAAGYDYDKVQARVNELMKK